MESVIDVNGSPETSSPNLSRVAVPQNTVASIINVPPQIAVTVCWIAVGFALAWWLFSQQKAKS